MKNNTPHLRQMDHYQMFRKSPDQHIIFDEFLYHVKDMGGHMYMDDQDFIENIQHSKLEWLRVKQYFHYLVNLNIIKRTEEGKVYLTGLIDLIKSHEDFIRIVEKEHDTNLLSRNIKVKKLKKKLKKKKSMGLNIKILVGIPASGKSTWAKAYVLDNSNTKRINRDDLRNMLDAGKTTDGKENFLRVLRLEIVKMCLALDKNIVIDDTNCYASKLEETIYAIRTMAAQMDKKIEIEVIDFDIDVDTCVERNKDRDGKVEEIAIYHMNNAKGDIDFDTLLIDKYEKIKGIN